MNVNIVVSKTMDKLDATTIANVIQWVETNIRAKLPPDTSLVITYTIIP